MANEDNSTTTTTTTTTTIPEGEVEEVETFDGTTTTTTTIPEENTGSTTTTSSTTSTTTTTSSTTTTTVPETWEQSTDIVIPEDELDIQGNEVKNNIDELSLDKQPLGVWLNNKNFSKQFQENYILPMSAAIWSMNFNDVLNYPISNLFSFLKLNN